MIFSTLVFIFNPFFRTPLRVVRGLLWLVCFILTAPALYFACTLYPVTISQLCYLAFFENSFVLCDDYLPAFSNYVPPLPHTCPLFPDNCSYGEMPRAFLTYYSTLLDCYQLHILEKPESIADADGNILSVDQQAASFNAERKKKIEFYSEQKSFWQRLVNLQSELKKYCDEVDHQVHRARMTQAYGFWILLMTLVLFMFLIMIIIL